MTLHELIIESGFTVDELEATTHANTIVEWFVNGTAKTSATRDELVEIIGALQRTDPEGTLDRFSRYEGVG